MLMVQNEVHKTLVIKLSFLMQQVFLYFNTQMSRKQVWKILRNWSISIITKTNLRRKSLQTHNCILYRDIRCVVSKVWDWNLASVKPRCENNFFSSIFKFLLFFLLKVWHWRKWSVDGNFSNKIFFSNEAHFTLCGYVNIQNCRI